MNAYVDRPDTNYHVVEANADSLVITGGEPLIYQLSYLTSELKARNIKTFIETSGAYPMSGELDWICLSPKKTMLPLEENFKLAHELKVIVYNQHDIKWAEELASKVNKDCILYLQPEWSKSEQLLPLIIDFVKSNTKWRISLQTHKFIHIP